MAVACGAAGWRVERSTVARGSCGCGHPCAGLSRHSDDRSCSRNKQQWLGSGTKQSMSAVTAIGTAVAWDSPKVDLQWEKWQCWGAGREGGHDRSSTQGEVKKGSRFCLPTVFKETPSLPKTSKPLRWLRNMGGIHYWLSNMSIENKTTLFILNQDSTSEAISRCVNHLRSQSWWKEGTTTVRNGNLHLKGILEHKE